MPVTWQNAAWIRRLIALARPNQDQINASGAVLSAQIVNDARWLSSREDNPAGFYVESLPAPAAGVHAAYFFEAIDTTILSTLLCHYMLNQSVGGVGPLSFELVVDPTTTIVWAAGPTVLAARGGDPGVDQRIRVARGEVLTANLPPGRSIMPGRDVSNTAEETTELPYSGQLPAMFTRNAALFFNVENAAIGARFIANLQAVRDI